MKTELLVNGAQVRVSLVGVVGEGAASPYGWRDANQPMPGAALSVVLGQWDGRQLQVDLDRCPDTLTVSGRLIQAEWYTLGLIRQLIADGLGVTVVGDDLFAGSLPAGACRVRELPDMRRLRAPGIVVCGRLEGRDLLNARVSRAIGGPIPVMIGDVPRARWSIFVGD
jgi:hypothetical protein